MGCSPRSQACDAVVTTSNVTAHLAGAIGKRTLVVFLHGRPPFHYWASPTAAQPLVSVGRDRDRRASSTTWDQALARAHELLRG